MLKTLPSREEPAWKGSLHCRALPSSIAGRVCVFFVLLALTCSPFGAAIAATTVATGTYTGNDSDGRDVYVGFEPEFVIVKSDAEFPAEGRVAGMPINASRSFVDGISSMNSDGIRNFRSDGFRVGKHDNTNKNGIVYHWTAFDQDPADMATGQYSGDGNDGRYVDGFGFSPDFVIVFASDTNFPVHHLSTMDEDQSFDFDWEWPLSNRIEDVRADGIVVGDEDQVNKSGDTYYWVAFDESDALSLGTYTGTGGLQNISTGSRPEYVFVQGAGYFPTVQRPASAGDDETLVFGDSGGYSDGITGLEDSGFMIGTHWRVNFSASTYHYAAFSNSVALPVNTDLAVSLSAGDLTPSVGDTLSLELAVENLGPLDVSALSLGFALPANLTWVSTSSGDGTFGEASGKWSLPDLDNGETANLQILARVEEDGLGETQTVKLSLLESVPVDTSPDNNESSVSVVPRGCDLALSKSVDVAAANEGEVVTYEIAVTNDGPDTATGIVVADVFPSGVTVQNWNVSEGNQTDAAWTIDSLLPGATATATIEATVDSGTGGTTILNTAAVAVDDPRDLTASNNSDTASFDAVSVDLAVRKNVDVETPANGDTISFELEVENLGPSSATGVVVTDLLPDGLLFVSATPEGVYSSGDGNWNVESLSAGEIQSLEIQVLVPPGLTGEVTNVATLSGVDQVDENADNDSASAAITVSSPSFSFAKTVDQSNPNVGDVVAFLLELTNEWDRAVPGLEVLDLLPAGLSYVAQHAGNGSYDSDTGIWSIPSLPPNTLTSLQISASVDTGTGGQTIVNQAELFNEDGDSRALDTASVVVQSSDLSLSAGATPTEIEPGEDTVVSFVVANGGPNAATRIDVAIALPSQLLYQSSTESEGTYDSGTGIWSIPSVSGGSDAKLDLVCRAALGTYGATLDVLGQVVNVDQEDPTAGDLGASTSVAVEGADLSVSKTVDNLTPTEDDPATFTIVVRNDGPSPAENVVVEDRLPDGLVLQGASGTRGSYSVGTELWTVGTLAVGEEESLFLTVTLEEDTAGNITNVARIVDSSPEDPNLGNNEDSAAVGGSLADLSVSLELSDPTPFVGDEIVLEIVVANDGPDLATDVQVRDLLDNGFQLAQVSAETGTYDAADGIWSVGSIASGQAFRLTLTLGVDSILGGTTLLNEARIYQATSPDPDESNDSDDVLIEVTSLVDLSISAEASPSLSRVGDLVTRTFTVSNLGPSSASAVSAKVTTDAKLVQQTHDASSGSYLPATGVWSIGTLAEGDAVELTLVAEVAASAANQSLAEYFDITAVTEMDGDDSNDSDQYTIEIASPLAVVATQAETDLLPGADPVQVLRLFVQNPSAFAETLTTVVVTDLSSGLGSVAEVSSNWTPLTLSFDGFSEPASVGGGVFTWTGLEEIIPASGEAELIFTLGAILSGRDGDYFDVRLDSEGLTFSRPVPYASSWPLDPAGSFAVDGRAAAQIAVVFQSGEAHEAGSKDHLLGQFEVLPNGYEPDVLESLTIHLDGTAEPDNDIDAVKFWRDGGDGLSDLGLVDDTLLGVAEGQALGNHNWTLSDLSLPILSAGETVFVSFDFADAATVGRTLSASLPRDPFGLNVTSENDGPVDEDVALSGTFTVSSAGSPEISVSAQTIETNPLSPGGEPVTIFVVEISNPNDESVSIEHLILTNKASGTGTQSQLDASWSDLTLRISESPLAGEVMSAAMSGGRAEFVDLPWSVPSEGSLVLQVEGAASVTAADGDLMGVSIESASDLTFGMPINTTAEWPLLGLTDAPVDGLTAAQVQTDPVIATVLDPGADEETVFWFRVPPNGYREDVLETVRLVNLGDATEQDMDRVQIYVEEPASSALASGVTDRGVADGQRVVDGPHPVAQSAGLVAQPAEFLGEAEFSAGRWVLDGLSEAVPATGLWIRVAVDLDEDATADATLQFALPTGSAPGLTLASGNDGPNTGVVANNEILVVGSGSNLIEVTGTGDILAVLTPGGLPIEILRTSWTNQSAQAETLQTLTFESGQYGAGTDEEVAGNWSSFELKWTGLLGTETATGVWSDGQVVFEGLTWVLRPGEVQKAALWTSALLTGRDADFLDPRLEASGVTLTRTVEMSADWPIDPVGWFEVDGIVSKQISLPPMDAVGLAAGSRRNPVLSVHLPANGYTTDVLRGINFNVIGSVESDEIDSMEIWLDRESGEFDPELNQRIGSLHDTGNRWEITGLAEQVPLDGLDIIATVDIAALALESHTLRLQIPGERTAITMESGNDGPWDAPVTHRVNHVISSPDRITLSTTPLEGGDASPGDRVPLLQVTGTNTYEQSRALTELTLRNVSVGPGQVDDLDQQFELVGIVEDSNGDGQLQMDTDRYLSTGSFQDGAVTFRNVDWNLAPRVSRDFFIVADVSRVFARDSDVLALELREPLDVGFSVESAVVGDWPLSSGTQWTVEGMVAEQIATFGTSARTLGPGQLNALVLDFSLPANGYENDVLTGVRVQNLGTALGEDVAELRIWADSGNDIFSPDLDLDLGTMFWSGTGWRSGALDVSLSGVESRFFVSLDVEKSLADSATIQLSIPLNGIEVASGNDGPIDEEVASGMKALLSTAPLLVTIETDPSASNADQIFSVKMTVTSQADETIEAILPALELLSTSSSFEWVDGPSPSQLDLASGESAEFVWTGSGTVSGTVGFVGSASGRSAENGAARSSLGTDSNPHTVFESATELQVFALASFPVSLNYGQEGVVPLSLTLRNPGGTSSSDIELREMQIRLEDSTGRDVIPATLLDRVVVNEGTRVYAEIAGGAIENESAVMDLIFDTPVRISNLEPTTLNLRFDLKSQSSVENYRVLIMGSAAFDAADATSATPVAVALQDGSFPIQSGLARLVSEAVVVEVSSHLSEAVLTSPGEEVADLWTFDLLNHADGKSASEVRVGSFALTFRTLDGNSVADLGDVFDSIWIESPLQTVASLVPEELSGDSVAVLLTYPLSLPVDATVPLTLRGRFATTTPYDSYQFELEDPESFDIRDSNTGSLVPAHYDGKALQSGPIHVQSPAEYLVAFGTAKLPEELAIGQEAVLALEATVEHPGNGETAGVDLRSWKIQLWDGRTVLPIAKYLDRVWLTWNGSEVAATNPTSDSETAILLTELHLAGGESGDLQIWIDLEATAASGPIEVYVLAEGMEVVDANTSEAVEVRTAKGEPALLPSGVSTLRLPARELFVEVDPSLPATLVADGREVAVARLVLTQPDEQSGPIHLDRLAIRTASEDGELFPAGDVAEAVRIYRDGELWGELDPSTAQDPLWLMGTPIAINGGDSAVLDLRVVFRSDNETDQVKFGFEEQDIGIVQPGTEVDEVEARAKTGQSFPFWTEVGNFGETDLATSYSNFPNPFAAGTDETSFVFYLKEAATVSLRLWTLHGKEVRTVVRDLEVSAGLHQDIQWDGRNGRGDVVLNGVYLAELDIQFTNGEKRELLRKVAVLR